MSWMKPLHHIGGIRQGHQRFARNILNTQARSPNVSYKETFATPWGNQAGTTNASKETSVTQWGSGEDPKDLQEIIVGNHARSHNVSKETFATQWGNQAGTPNVSKETFATQWGNQARTRKVFIWSTVGSQAGSWTNSVKALQSVRSQGKMWREKVRCGGRSKHSSLVRRGVRWGRAADRQWTSVCDRANCRDVFAWTSSESSLPSSFHTNTRTHRASVTHGGAIGGLNSQ